MPTSNARSGVAATGQRNVSRHQWASKTWGNLGFRSPARDAALPGPHSHRADREDGTGDPHAEVAQRGAPAGREGGGEEAVAEGLGDLPARGQDSDREDDRSGSPLGEETGDKDADERAG